MKGQGFPKARLLTGPWAGTPESVPECGLDVAVLDLGELVRRAFVEPREAGVLLLEFRRSVRLDRHLLFQALPWLNEVEDAEKIVAQLLEMGWVLLKCGSRDAAERLCPKPWSVRG